MLIGVQVGAVALVAGIVLAALPVPIYLALALLLDRYEPEPATLLALTFLWGAGAATGIALLVNTTGQALVSEGFGSDVGQLYGSSVSAPVVEESVKAVALLAIYRWRRTELDGVLDGIVYAAMVGLGFAFTENVLYYARALAEGQDVLAGTFFARGILAPFAHPLFTSLTGVGFALAARSPRAGALPAVLGLVGAIVLHALWNSSAADASGAGFLAVYTLIMLPTFLAVLMIAVVARAREGRMVRERLGPEVASGVLGPRDVEALASLRARRRALRATPPGPPRRARKQLYRSAVDLAFLRRQLERLPESLRRAALDQEAQLGRRVWELAWEAAGRAAPGSPG